MSLGSPPFRIFLPDAGSAATTAETSQFYDFLRLKWKFLDGGNWVVLPCFAPLSGRVPQATH